MVNGRVKRLGCAIGLATAAACVGVHAQTDEPARGAPLSAWNVGPRSRPALEALRFGMDVDQAWRAAPSLREGLDVRLPPDEYDAAQARLPGLGRGWIGGNRWYRTKHRRTEWPRVDGARWKLSVSGGNGLMSVTARYPSEQALRRAVASRGAPDRDARWEFWFDDATGTRAAFTGCFQPTINGQPDGEAECNLELMPTRSLDDLVSQLFPRGGTLIGRERDALPIPAGVAAGDRVTRHHLTPLPTSLYLPLEVQVDERERVVGYRTALSYTYDAERAPEYRRALRARLGVEPPTRGCASGRYAGAPVEVCARSMQYVVTVGAFDGR